MADGNIGSLWLSLGIRDEMSKAIEKITKGMRGVDEATQKAKREGEGLVKALENVNGNNFARIFREANAYIAKNSKEISGIAKILKNLGDSNAFTGTLLKAKGLEETAAALRKANAELAVLANTEGKEADVSQWRTKISNALDYIKLLQDIIGQEKKLDNTKALNPNVDTKSLDNAKKSLEGFRAEMTRLLQSGGVDDSNVLGSFKKLLDVAKKDVQDIVATFKKDNPLSLFSGGAAKVETDLARVTEKLARLRDLMTEGTRKGFMTDMLGGSITELDKIMARLNAAKLNPTMLMDVAQMRNLISDVLVEMTKATVAESAYRRERGKTIAANKEAEAAEKRNVAIVEAAVQRRIQARKIEAQKAAEAEREANRYAAESVNKAIAAKREQRRQKERDNKQRLSEIKAAEARYDSLGNKVRALRREFSRGVALGADVSKTEAEIRRLIGIMRYLMTLKDRLASGDFNALGRLGSTGSGHDATLAGRVLQDQRAINAAQEKTNREKEKSIELERAHQQEVAKTAAKVRGIWLRHLSRPRTIL